MTDLASQVANLLRSINGEDIYFSYEPFFEAMDETFPHASYEAIVRAQKILENDYLAEPLGWTRSSSIKRMLALCGKAIPESIRFEKTISEPAPGHVCDLYVFGSFDRDSPLSQAWVVLFSVAVDLHPDWWSAGNGWCFCSNENGDQGTPTSLVRWFLISHLSTVRILENALHRRDFHD